MKPTNSPEEECMKNLTKNLSRISQLFVGLITVLLFSIGCSNLESPTLSNDAGESLDLWSPQLGDELVEGRQIPIILDEMYWETPGMVNPALRGIGNFSAYPIDGNIGGTVRCGYHSFVVPPGAVGGIVNFTMSLASGTGIGVDCGPSPLSFNDGLPVRLTLSFAGTQYDADYCERAGIEPLDPSDLQIFYVPNDGSEPVQQDIGRVLDAGAKTISVEVDHFSRYIIA